MRPTRRLSQSRRRGMALLLVVAVVVILTIIVTGLWESAQPSWDESTLSRARFQAGLLAESGANIASHPDIGPGDAALWREYGDGRSFEARITTEGGRLLVNSLDEDLMRETARELFIRWGVDASSAEIAADSLADWIDEDGDPRANGAENGFYGNLDFPEFPPNEDFSSLEQLLLVRGMDEVARVQPLWRDFFTLYGDGFIDVNAAPADLIAAFFGVTDDAALNFAVTRDGDDGITGTVDDYRYEDTTEVQTVLGVGGDEWGRVAGLVTLSGAIRRIESVGRVGDYEVRRIVLVTGEGETAAPVARLRE